MPEEKKEKQDIMIEILGEMLKWIKVTSIPQVKKLLLDILPSDKEKIAYHFSDGRDSRGVAQFADVSHVHVTRWWKTWIRSGIAEPVSARGGERAKRIFSREDFGIEVPSARETEPLKKETDASTHEKPAQESSEVKVTQGSLAASEKTEESM